MQQPLADDDDDDAQYDDVQCATFDTRRCTLPLPQCRHLDGRGLATDYDAVCEDQRDQFPRPEAFNACKHGAKHGDVLGCEIGCRNAKVGSWPCSLTVAALLHLAVRGPKSLTPRLSASGSCFAVQQAEHG